MDLSRLRSLLVGLAAAALAAPASAFGIGLQPTTVELTVEPGERNRQVINIANVDSEQTVSLTIALADWSLDEQGQIQLTPPGEQTWSAADWTRFSPAFLTLGPGEAQQVIVDISSPTRLPRAGDFRFALLASTILPEEREGQTGVWKKYQIASLFYLTAGNAQSTPEIRTGRVVVGEDGAARVEIEVENPGNAHARLRGDIEFTANGQRRSVPVNNLVVLHEGRRNYVAQLPEGADVEAPVKVHLTNIFAPQEGDDYEILPPYTIAAPTKRAEITPAAAPVAQ